VLVPTANGFPWLAKPGATPGSFVNQPGGATFTMVGDDVAYLALHLDHQSRTIRVEIADAGGRDMHEAFQWDYAIRNTSATGFFALSWDGVTYAGNKAYVLPNGQYRATLSVLKALGDAANPAHWETWTSPVITIARP
jgi:hypothetical protein